MGSSCEMRRVGGFDEADRRSASLLPSSRFRISRRRGAAWTTTTIWSSRASWTRRNRRTRISTTAAICRARRPPTRVAFTRRSRSAHHHPPVLPDAPAPRRALSRRRAAVVREARWMEGNPVAPITPLPGSCFDLSRAPMSMKRTMSGDTNADAKGFVDASDEVDIEEDRVDPLSCPRRCRRPRKSPRPRAKESARARWRCRRPSPACTTCPRCRRRTKGCPLHLHCGTNGTGTGTLRFCRVGGGATNASAAASGSQRVHTTRARDGGRTQSGGVHGMLTEDQ
ncbi:hypothetical protein K438DRAFT_580552 [Mycena galopus ATCC 62051]|nr:hypothetical protein K438DRAFT_580552 [Mycena galopus ATCC 62051]